VLSKEPYAIYKSVVVWPYQTQPIHSLSQFSSGLSLGFCVDLLTGP